MEAVYGSQFPLSRNKDRGYETDREGSIAITVQPSQGTVTLDSPPSPGGPWEGSVLPEGKAQLPGSELPSSKRYVVDTLR